MTCRAYSIPVPLMGFVLRGVAPFPGAVCPLEHRNPREVKRNNKLLRPLLQGLAHQEKSRLQHLGFSQVPDGSPLGLPPLQGFPPLTAKRISFESRFFPLTCF